MVGIERCGSLILCQNNDMSVLQRRAKAAKNSWKSTSPNPESSCQNPSTEFLPRQSPSLPSNISSGSFICPLVIPTTGCNSKAWGLSKQCLPHV